VRIGNFAVAYLSHACFRFTTPEGKVLLTDPFFSPGFKWQNHIERRLTPSYVPVSAIKVCDIIFVSHIHGDHYDANAILAIHAATHARVLAPPDVLESLAARGMEDSSLLVASEGELFRFGDLTIHTYAGYDESFDAQGRPNKFSLVAETGATRLFYSGDCHHLPPAVRGMKVEAMFCWPHPKDDKLVGLVKGLEARCFVLMHGDRFEPGRFFCNFNYAAQKKRMATLCPEQEVVIPKRTKRL